MKDKDIKRLIEETVNKYLREYWVNPYYCKKFIPAENVELMKQELFDTLMLTKRNK